MGWVGAVLTSVEPEHEGLGRRVLLGLEEPVEESGAARLADGDVPGVLRVAGVEALPGHPLHPVPRLLLPPIPLPVCGGGRDVCGGGQDEEEPDGPGGSGGGHRGGDSGAAARRGGGARG